MLRLCQTNGALVTYKRSYWRYCEDHAEPDLERGGEDASYYVVVVGFGDNGRVKAAGV